MFAGSKGFALAWPYCLMQAGMNANKKEDVLSDGYGLFVLSCVLWLMVLFVLAGWILKKKDVRREDVRQDCKKFSEIIKISGLFVFSDAPAMQPCYNYRNLGN